MLCDVIDIEDWGASPYGDPSTNAAVINMALDTGRTVAIPAKTFPICGSINLTTRGQTLFGLGSKSALVQQSPNTDCLILAQSALAEVTVKDLSIIAGTGVDFSQGGVGLKSCYVGNSLISNVSVVKMHRGFYIDTRTNVNTSDVYLMKVQCYDTVSDGIVLNNCCQVYVSHSASKSCGGNGVKIIDGSAVHLDHILSLGNDLCGVRVQVGSQESTDWHFFDQVECDDNEVDGFRISNTKGAQISNCWSGTSGQIGWNFLGANAQLLMSNSTAKNNKVHGFYADAMTDSGIANFAANWNGENSSVGTGLMLNGSCVGVSISNPIVSEILTPKKQKYGIRVCGSSSDIQVTGGRGRGNLVASYENISSGTGNRVTAMTGYN